MARWYLHKRVRPADARRRSRYRARTVVVDTPFFENVHVPCKTSQQVQKPRAPVLVGWLYEMRAHFDECLAAVPEEDRSRAFARGGLKTFGLLPLATPRAKHAQASPAALYCSKTSSPSRTVRARAVAEGRTCSRRMRPLPPSKTANGASASTRAGAVCSSASCT